MSKVTLHFKFLPFLMLLFQVGTSQDYISLDDSFKCSESKAYSIYATADEVDLLIGYLDECGDLEYLKIIGHKPGAHWDLLFEVLSKHQKLKGLELYYNEGLTELPKKIIRNANLRVITIVGNRRLDYNDLFKKLSKLKNLESVTLMDNKLDKIPDALGDIKQLKKLKISGNEGVDYETLISKLKKNKQLEELYIPLNSISEIPENIGELKGLKTLDIRNNYIAEFPDAISQLDSLQKIRTEDNIILDVFNEFDKLKNLNIKFLSFDEDDSVKDLKLLFPDANIQSKKNKHVVQSEIVNEKSIGKVFNNIYYVECWDAIDQYNILFKKRFSYSDFDSLDFFSRLTNTDYCYNDRVVADGSYEGVELVLHNKRRWFKRKYALPRYKLNKDEIGFSINPKGNYYPELKAFTGMLWIYVGGKTEQDFYKAYVKKKSWKDVYLEYDFSTKTFFIVLKKDQLQKIPVYPRYINKSARLKDAQKQYNKRFNMYDKRLNLRAKRFDRSVEKEHEKNRKIYQKWENIKWNKLEAHMCAYETTLKREAWLDFKKHMINQQHAPLDTAIATKELLLTSLKIKRIRFEEKPFVSVKRNFVNSVSAFIELNIKDSLRLNDVPISLFLYRKDKGVMDLHSLKGTTGVEFDVNSSFVVVLQKGDKYLVLSKKEFMNEVRSNFTEKGKIELMFLKPFKTYSLSALWRAIEFKEQK